MSYEIVTVSCPNCNSGLRPDGSTCATCAGHGSYKTKVQK